MVLYLNDLQYPSCMNTSRRKRLKYVAYFDFVKISIAEMYQSYEQTLNLLTCTYLHYVPSSRKSSLLN
jgi:hypothetical protein